MRRKTRKGGGLGYPLWMNGKQVRGAVRLTHAPSATGSYYLGPTPIGEYVMNPNAVGSYVRYPVRGLGQNPAEPVIGAGIIMLGAIILGAAGWYAGKAMAPTTASENAYKWAGAITNILLPGIGLGVVGVVALSGRGRALPAGA